MRGCGLARPYGGRAAAHCLAVGHDCNLIEFICSKQQVMILRRDSGINNRFKSGSQVLEQ